MTIQLNQWKTIKSTFSVLVLKASSLSASSPNIDVTLGEHQRSTTMYYEPVALFAELKYEPTRIIVTNPKRANADRNKRLISFQYSMDSVNPWGIEIVTCICHQFHPNMISTTRNVIGSGKITENHPSSIDLTVVPTIDLLLYYSSLWRSTDSMNETNRNH